MIPKLAEPFPHPSIRLIPYAQLTPAPWKNGGGITREIAAAPPKAAMDTFVWRISIAQVDQPGPFSRFAGIDRTIVVTHGSGMRLIDHDSGQTHALQRWQPFGFSGATTIYAELPDGPTQDFNLMLRHDQAWGEVRVHHDAQHLTLGAGDTILHCAAGQFNIDVLAQDNPCYALETGDTFHIRVSDGASVTLDIAPMAVECALIDARITMAPISKGLST